MTQCPFGYAAPKMTFCTSDCALWTEHGCSIKLLATNNLNPQNLVKTLENLLQAVEINMYFKESQPSSERLSQ
jgi:hypothetical protein